MVTMCTMEVAVYQIADMVAVRDHGMATVVAVVVITSVLVAEVLGRAAVGMLSVDRYDVFVHAAGGHIVQMTIVHVIVVISMGNELVLTVEAMHMGVCVGHVFPRSPLISRA